jgi:transglutaminase-like putative cysteine protease
MSAEMQTVYTRADEILGRIVSDNMTIREKAYAIYRWVRYNIRYASAPEEYDTIQGAYDGLRRGAGDCFTFYAISEVLLTRAEIPNMRIQRIPEADVHHFWNLVDLGEGWYHFDSCPPFVPVNGFMFTDSKSREYTIIQRPYRLHYYDYVKADYPQVVE